MDIQERESLAAAEDQGIEVTVEDEKGELQFQADGVTPITITVSGMLSKRYQASQHVQRGRIVKKAIAEIEDIAQNGNGGKATARAWDIAMFGWPEELLNLEEEGRRSIEAQRETVAMCVVGWSDGFTAGGEPFGFSYANAMRLLKAYPHIQRKLEKAMENHARFFEPRSTN